jgi:hypothetical protein
MSLSSSERLGAQPRRRSRLWVLALLGLGNLLLLTLPVFGFALFPLTMALVIAWVLWRNETRNGPN